MARTNTRVGVGSSPPRPSPRAGRELLLSVAIGQDETHRRVELRLLDRLRRVDALGAHDRALADEAAFPDALRVADDRLAQLQPLVARVEVVAPRDRRRGRAKELVVQPVNGAGRVAQHAVDALAELAELVD